MKKLHYEKSGDNYKIKDPFKIIALREAKKTSKNILRFKKLGFSIKEAPESRGESAYRITISSNKSADFQLAHVEEGIGTKNVIADELAGKYGNKVYESIAIDNVASIFNDLATTGASPLSFLLHIAAYPTEWYTDVPKIKAILSGTAKACSLAGASWGGGESATMRDIIVKDRFLLSGSATGIISPSNKALTEDKLKSGDRIILLESSGVHTNGITLLRKELLERLPNGYGTKLSDGSTYGKALLTPSIIYSKVMEDLLGKTEIHYAVHITGHGWRKLMRSKRNFSYVLETVPKPHPIFELIKKYTYSSDKDMYGSYNMGAGFALFAPDSSVKKILRICEDKKIKALDVGYIKPGIRSILIKPLRITFDYNEMILR